MVRVRSVKHSVNVCTTKYVLTVPSIMEPNRYMFLLIVFYFHCSQAEVRLSIYYASSAVSEGTSAEFDCYSSNIPNNFLEAGGRVEWCRYPTDSSLMEVIGWWSRDDGVQYSISNPDGQYSIEGGMKTFSLFSIDLNIRHTEKSDQGQYYCALYNSTRNEIVRSRSIELKVKYPPADHYPLCQAIPEDVGDNVELRCDSEKTTPPPTVQWYKDGAKVAEGRSSTTMIRSSYEARPDELGSQFECQLAYDDQAGIEIHRSCRFQRPIILISKKEGEPLARRFYIFAHSNPSFLSVPICITEPSNPEIPLHFQSPFSGYGVLTVGPYPTEGDGVINIVCRAKNVFGYGEANVTVSVGEDDHGIDSSIHPVAPNNLFPVDGNVQVNVSPNVAIFAEGENSTLYCSFRSVVVTSRDTDVKVSWTYNGDVIDESMPEFLLSDNLLHVNGLPNDGEEGTVACKVDIIIDGTVAFSNESSAVVKHGSSNHCAPKQALKDEEKGSTMMNVVGICVLGAVVLILLIVVIILRRRNTRMKSVPYDAFLSSPRVSFRANPEVQKSSQSGNTAVINRALPAQPIEAAATTTPSHVVLTPSANDIAFESLSKQKLESISSKATTTSIGIELPYQEMVGDTGIVKTRQESIASDLRRDEHHPLQLTHSVSVPREMIPGPNRGFLSPSSAIARGRQRTMSETHEGKDEANYEDPDSLRERRRLGRAMSNDYQPQKHTNIPCKQDLAPPQYANSFLVDDSVFPGAV